jgi:hypothetical protein
VTVAVAGGHVLLNAVYLASGLLYETMTIATGLSVVFAVALAAALLCYTSKQLRWALVGFVFLFKMFCSLHMYFKLYKFYKYLFLKFSNNFKLLNFSFLLSLLQIFAAYFSLNLVVTSSLLMFAFGQDLLYMISVWQTNASDLGLLNSLN